MKDVVCACLAGWRACAWCFLFCLFCLFCTSYVLPAAFPLIDGGARPGCVSILPQARGICSSPLGSSHVISTWYTYDVYIIRIRYEVPSIIFRSIYYSVFFSVRCALFHLCIRVAGVVMLCLSCQVLSIPQEGYIPRARFIFNVRYRLPKKNN